MKQLFVFGLALLVVLIHPGAVYASLTVNTTAISGVMLVKDLTVDSTGNVHVLEAGETNVSYKEFSDGVQQGGTVEMIDLGGSTGGAVYRIEVDSNNNPGLLLRNNEDGITGGHVTIYFHQYDGESWYQYQASSTFQGVNAYGRIDFDYFNAGTSGTGVGANDPYMVECEDGEIVEYVWNGSTFVSSSVQVGGTDFNCEYLDMEITSGDVVHIVARSYLQSQPIYHLVNAANRGGWSTSTIAMVTGSPSGYNNAISLTLHDDKPYFTTLNHSANTGEDEIVYGYYDGSWTTGTVATGVELATSNFVDENVAASDGTNMFTAYRIDAGEGASDIIYAYSSNNGSSWTTGNVATGITGDIVTPLEGAYDTTESEYLLWNAAVTFPATINAYQYEMSLAGGGGGSGDPVPDMSFYMTMLVIALGGWYVWREQQSQASETV